MYETTQTQEKAIYDLDRKGDDSGRDRTYSYEYTLTIMKISPGSITRTALSKGYSASDVS